MEHSEGVQKSALLENGRNGIVFSHIEIAGDDHGVLSAAGLDPIQDHGRALFSAGL